MFRNHKGLDLPEPSDLRHKVPEWDLLESLGELFSKIGTVDRLGASTFQGQDLPIYSFSLGSRQPRAPVLGLFGGVHGLERIGSQVCLALLESLGQRFLWDELLRSALQEIRIVSIPLLNPWGIYRRKRANPRGVDLMRNAPLEATGSVTPWVGGQKFSPHLPWFRGFGELEIENQILLSFCQNEFFEASRVITVDFHSGFGVQDQIWCPYAGRREPFPHLAEFHGLKELFEKSHPHHFYRIEPQAKNYTTHGDMWDYIYEQYRQKNTGVYLPLALEMGSWMWVRKNPLQLFSPLGVFNPVKPHRQKRILRRHLGFFDFLMRALVSPSHWAQLNVEQKHKNERRARELWYE